MLCTVIYSKEQTIVSQLLQLFPPQWTCSPAVGGCIVQLQLISEDFWIQLLNKQEKLQFFVEFRPFTTKRCLNWTNRMHPSMHPICITINVKSLRNQWNIKLVLTFVVRYWHGALLPILLYNVISEWLPSEYICPKVHAYDIMHCQLWFSSLVNLSNLISYFNAGVEGMECSLPMDGRRVSLTQLSKDSFRECQATLTLTDLLIIIFSGISVSVVAIMTSFFLASTVHCFQRWSKGAKGDEEESEEWEGFTFLFSFLFLRACMVLLLQTMRGQCVCDMWQVFMLLPPWWVSGTV